MKVLWLTPSDMLTELFHGSLESLGEHDIFKCWYDKIGVPVDRGMLDAVNRIRPDVILYLSQADGPYVASPDTFRRLKDICPTVHLCLDAYDIGFKEKLELYKKKECFTLTVACDGGASGPVDMVLFHPVDPRPYISQEPALGRPLMLGTCGGFPNGLRREVMDHLGRTCGLIIKPREEVYGSYHRYASFLKNCSVVVDCALSAGGHDGKGPYARTLKTRAIEVGLAGSCLMELRGCALNKWAVEDKDYATYETPGEAESVYHGLMKNPAKLGDMAHNLRQIVTWKMSPAVFYQEVFTACELLPRSENTSQKSA